MIGGATIVSFVALLYIIEVVDAASGQRLNKTASGRLNVDGLWGIIWAPLLHANWAHLIANTGPGAGARIPDDARRDGAVHLRHGDRVDPRWASAPG